jgi:hypothetical protein
MGGPAVDSVDNSPQTPTCPRYPQPYDDGTPISGILRTLPEDHNKHSLKWYNFWGEPQCRARPLADCLQVGGLDIWTTLQYNMGVTAEATPAAQAEVARIPRR